MTAPIRSLIVLALGAAHAPAAEPPVAPSFGDKDPVVHAPAFGYYPTQWRTYPGQLVARPTAAPAVTPSGSPIDRSPPPVQRVYPPDAKPIAFVPLPTPPSNPPELIEDAPPAVAPLLPVGATIRGAAPERDVPPPSATPGAPQR